MCGAEKLRVNMFSLGVYKLLPLTVIIYCLSYFVNRWFAFAITHALLCVTYVTKNQRKISLY